MMKRLLGRAWFLYDLCFNAMLLLVLGVVNATAAAMIRALTGLPSWVGNADEVIGGIAQAAEEPSGTDLRPPELGGNRVPKAEEDGRNAGDRHF